ncbi:MAG TPA: ATPase [Candidatus Moranbacteria bacterium]|nr:ATPase [Candidatus Moranbacteria bacterium]HAT74982.1 ATPase [Candidatus Moranbacteria bacterium]
MDKNTIKLIVVEQRKNFEKKLELISRKISKGFVESKKISVISGIRRSGKSTLLKQIAKNFSGYYYFNFEDERLLDFKAVDLNVLYEALMELYGEQRVFFFDEIQNVCGWEKFACRLFEDGKKIFITGSNAKLLSSELATTLSGRHLKMELYPFSFDEFLKYENFPDKDFYDTKERSALARYFNRYLEYGGFPEIVTSKNKKELEQLYQDILIKDLIVRFKIRETKIFREIALYLLSNITAPMSFNNVRNMVGVKSVTTVKNYVDFFEEAYLFFSLFKFDYSIKKQIINDRKVYAVDTGLANSVAFKFSEKIGANMENIVFIELKRREADIYYYKDKKECDFVVRKGLRISEAIQVSQNLSDPETEKREITGLLEAMEKFNLKKGLIITESQEEKRKIKNKTIEIVPAWKWLLDLK